MKILFVCMQYIHSARWINQLKDSGHEIYVFDCLDKPIHQDLQWTNYITNWSKRKLPYIKGEHFLEKKLPKIYEKVAPILKITASEKLKKIIQEIKPDLVHSLEMQSQTYPLIQVREKINFNWAYFCWGSDLYLYQNQANHLKEIYTVLSKLNYLFTDNTRDQNIAEELGFRGEIIPKFPGGGGYKLEDFKKYIKPLKEKKLIVIKGYHHWAGKALFVLNALTLIYEEIKNFNIYVYSAHPVVIEKIKELKQHYNLKIEYSSRYNEITHDELLQKFGKALIAIGNNSSDGIPNTLLEAIICGAFPIQSNPGGATEDYIEHGKNGFLISNPEDEKEIAEHILTVINSPKLIKQAYTINIEKFKKLAYEKIRKQVLQTYKNIEAKL